jgi:hypothetical protein
MERNAKLSPSQALQIMAIGVMLKDGELELAGADAQKAKEAIIDASQEIALQIGAPAEPEDGNVLKLHKGFPAQEVVPTLRRIIDQIEDGDYGTVTTACVCIGHTSEKPVPGQPIRAMHSDFFTFAAGPRVDMFTVRGLLLTCAQTLGNAS